MQGMKNKALFLALHFGVNAPDQFAAIQNRHHIITIDALWLGGIDLDAIVEIPEHFITISMPEQIVERRQKHRHLRRMPTGFDFVQ